MIYSLDGTLTYFDQNFAVVSCGGVGFKCFTTLTTLQSLPGVGKPVQLYTYLSVREDALDLYGFTTAAELDCFKLLISVNGVGPKAALAILSELSADRLAVCIAGGDAKSLTRAPGIGKKIAERIVLELKDKWACWIWAAAERCRRQPLPIPPALLRQRRWKRWWLWATDKATPLWLWVRWNPDFRWTR